MKEKHRIIQIINKNLASFMLKVNEITYIWFTYKQRANEV